MLGLGVEMIGCLQAQTRLSCWDRLCAVGLNKKVQQVQACTHFWYEFVFGRGWNRCRVKWGDDKRLDSNGCFWQERSGVSSQEVAKQQHHKSYRLCVWVKIFRSSSRRRFSSCQWQVWVGVMLMTFVCMQQEQNHIILLSEPIIQQGLFKRQVCLICFQRHFQMFGSKYWTSKHPFMHVLRTCEVVGNHFYSKPFTGAASFLHLVFDPSHGQEGTMNITLLHDARWHPSDTIVADTFASQGFGRDCVLVCSQSLIAFCPEI